MDVTVAVFAVIAVAENTGIAVTAAATTLAAQIMRLLLLLLLLLLQQRISPAHHTGANSITAVARGA